MANLCCSVKRNNVNGTPISLLKLPFVNNTASGLPAVCCRMDAVISFTVVLPEEPVIATVRGLIFSRNHFAN